VLAQIQFNNLQLFIWTETKTQKTIETKTQKTTETNPQPTNIPPTPPPCRATALRFELISDFRLNNTEEKKRWGTWKTTTNQTID